ELRLDSLAESEALRAAEIPAARGLTGDRDLDFVRAGRQIAGVDALHAAALQRLELFEAVDVVRGELPVDADLHRVETKRLAFRQGDEDRDVRVRRIEEPFLQPVELGRYAE